MNIKKAKMKCGKVTVEGEPLLLIAGGGGDGKWYSLVADILSDEYKVITYDRRANARSTMNHPYNFDIHQESRDAVAVIQATGETSAYIFGNSSGAIIALDMAITQPQAVRVVVAHEPPIASVHPRANKWKKFFAKVYLTSFRFGGTVAMLRFIIGAGLLQTTIESAKATKVINEAIREVNQNHQRISSKDSAEFFAKQELLAVTNYYPDFKILIENCAKVILAAGKMSIDQNRFYAQTVPVLAEKIGCKMAIFPGHHGSYMDMPDEWAAVLRNTLHKAIGNAP